MKLKYYLRGLGIGVICTAVIMGIALSGGKKERLTDDEIIERARLLGMVMEEEEQTEKESGGQEEEAPDADGQEQEPKDGQQSPGEGKPQEQEPQGAAPQSPDESQSQGTGEGTGAEADVPTDVGAAQPEIKNIEIHKGEYSDVICGKLQEAGLISDAAAFNRHLTQIGVDDQLQPGVYDIPVGASEDEIVGILSKK